jgi:isopentenyldiphosphate isomerase
VGFDDYYLVEVDLDIRELTLQPEEVQRVKWATKEEILTMIDQEIFIPYRKSLIELLFDMRKYMGSHS